jgi:hypothetical protein
MSIARRKAGTVVRCPACTREIVVPPEGEDPVAKPTPTPAAKVFERSDFDEIFEPALGKVEKGRRKQVALPPTPAPAAMPAETGYDVERIEPSRQPAVNLPPMPTGFWLTGSQATWLSIGALAALALAFVAGLLVGLFLSRG